MKSNKLIFAIALVVLTFSAQAKPVDEQVAVTVAHSYYTMVLKQSAIGLTPAIVYRTSFVMEENAAELPGLYVVAFSDKGFVIVAGDDRSEPVIGFSTESGFDASAMPPALSFMLDEYTKEMQAIAKSEATTTSPRWASLLNYAMPAANAVVVGPLVTSHWHQQNPYNSLCPEDANSTAGGHVQVGCGAIVMGQVMRYWRWPVTGISSHSYTSNYGTLSADFANTTYQYEHMPNTLSSSSSTIAINAVATLLYHCGVAVNMNYGPTASWSNSNNIVPALSAYFGYPATIQYKERNYYTDSQWLDMTKGELDDFAPFFYGGTGSQGGHVFVCDGYRDDDYFHINWGFGGGYDGYFMLSDLTPGPYSFNSSQAIIIGIRGPQVPGGCTEHATAQLTVYPNPANQTIHIALPESVDGCINLRICDMEGRTVIARQRACGASSQCDLDVSMLAPGIYLLNVDTRNGHFVQKVVIE